VTSSAPSTRDDLLAPVDFIVVEFPDGVPTAAGFDRLLDLVDRNVIQVLDVEFIAKDDTGVRVVPVSELPAGSAEDLSEWIGSSSGLLEAEDIATIGEQIGHGSVAVAVVFENVWVLDVVAGWSQSGARLVLDGAVQVDDLLHALDATESN
jgi:hypothetical protein